MSIEKLSHWHPANDLSFRGIGRWPMQHRRAADATYTTEVILR
jgi:hypothetical protein